jgi:hypothetical protein
VRSHPLGGIRRTDFHTSLSLQHVQTLDRQSVRDTGMVSAIVRPLDWRNTGALQIIANCRATALQSLRHILGTNLRGREDIALTVGSADEPGTLPPSHHYGCEGKLQWVNLSPDLPCQDTQERW